MAAVIVTSARPLPGHGPAERPIRPTLQLIDGGRRAARAYARANPGTRRLPAGVYRRRRLGACCWPSPRSSWSATWPSSGWASVLAAPPAVGRSSLAVASAGASSSARFHVVQPGDTLWSIARSLHPSGDLRPVVDALESRAGGADPGPRSAAAGRWPRSGDGHPAAPPSPAGAARVGSRRRRPWSSVRPVLARAVVSRSDAGGKGGGPGSVAPVRCPACCPPRRQGRRLAGQRRRLGHPAPSRVPRPAGSASPPSSATKRCRSSWSSVRATGCRSTGPRSRPASGPRPRAGRSTTTRSPRSAAVGRRRAAPGRRRDPERAGRAGRPRAPGRARPGRLPALRQRLQGLRRPRRLPARGPAAQGHRAQVALSTRRVGQART